MKISLPLLALASLVSAKICVNNTVLVNITSRNPVYGNVAIPDSQYAVTAFTQFLARQGGNATAQAATGFANVNGTYRISTEFCRPDNMNNSNAVVQVLTHGIGFDKTYWDLSYDNYNYSYVNQATDKYGYCTLSYDRLGVGNSSKGDPRDEIQANLEVQALYQLTTLLRNGSFPGVNHTFETVLHAGHSFGSALTYQLVNLYPNISDGIALTGFSTNSSFMASFILAGNFANANTNQPSRFANTSNGYLVSSNSAAIQAQFFAPPYFDYKGVLPFSDQTKQPATIGEFLSLGAMAPNNSYAGPVLVLTGDQDLPFCGGNCLATGNPNITSIPATVQKAFPNVPTSKYYTYIQPHSGHAINLHYNATSAYAVMNSFFNVTGSPATYTDSSSRLVGRSVARSTTRSTSIGRRSRR